MQAINNHALGFFAKPINIEELYVCINSIKASIAKLKEDRQATESEHDG